MTSVIFFSRDTLSKSDPEETDKPKLKENGIQKLQGCEKIRKKSEDTSYIEDLKTRQGKATGGSDLDCFL